MWVLLPGAREGDELVVETDSLSFWSLAAVKTNVSGLVSGLSALLRDSVADAPTCQEGVGYSVEVSSAEGDPILHACPEQVDGKPAVHVYNRRAIALDYQLPEGAEARTTGGELSEAAWDKINSAIASVGGVSGGRLVPGGGEAVIAFPNAEALEDIEFRPTNQALATDILVQAVAKQGMQAEKAIAGLVEFAGCIHQAAGNVSGGMLTAGDWFDLLVGCGGALANTGLAVPGAALAGAIQTAKALRDQIDLLNAATVVLERSPVELLPSVEPVLASCEGEFTVNGIIGGPITTTLDCAEAQDVAETLIRCTTTEGDVHACSPGQFSCSSETSPAYSSGEVSRITCRSGDDVVEFDAGT